MIRVLHINDKLEVSGGVEVYIYQLMELSAEHGIDAGFVGLIRGEDGSVITKEIDGEQTSFSNTDWQTQLATRISNADILHLHSISDPKLIKWLASQKPLVRSMHEPRMVCPGKGKFWRYNEEPCGKVYGWHCFKHAYTKGCCNRNPGRLLRAYNNVRFETTHSQAVYQSVIVMSEFMRKECILAGIPDKVLSLNPYFTPLVDPKVESDSTGKKRILFVGRLSRTKGVHYFIKLGIRLLSQGMNVEMEIIGDGIDRDEFENMVPQQYAGDFHFKGWMDSAGIDRAMRESYLVIFPSIYPEAFGIVGLEAMVRGLPVIGFDVGGVSTWLEDGRTGYLIPPKDEDSLFARTVDLLTDRSRYKELSQNARKAVVKRFNPSRHMLQLKEEYKKACDG